MNNENAQDERPEKTEVVEKKTNKKVDFIEIVEWKLNNSFI